MTFHLETKEINIEELMKADAGYGEFYFCNAGTIRECNDIYFYGNSSDQFFFFARWVEISEEEKNIEIFRATTIRLGGPAPRIPVIRLEIIQRDLEYLFRTRRYVLLDRPIILNEIPTNVLFTWKMA